ncbi:MAG: type II toxin-antitoxin system PemK/MazF family toxin [Nitrospinae bacterium]|nr:type II toxin-antitoxin system PemK/MazF family toxin [Nitrospinota bacterium]
MSGKGPERGDVFWVRLDPTAGTEVKKTRPGIIVSNNAQNAAGSRVIMAPVTSSIGKVYSFETRVAIGGKPGKAMLDQIRAVDKIRLAGYIGRVTPDEMRAMEEALKLVLDLTV